FKVNPKIYLKDPESSESGKEIIKHSIDLINKLGYEHFTFKKLADNINTTEATIYRYFINKYSLLLYILNWYWCYMEFLLSIKLINVLDKKEKLIIAIDLLTSPLYDLEGLNNYSKEALNEIVITESCKTYLIKEVSEINKNQVFKPYKDLCASIALIISENNETYKYPKSLATTIIESSHQQQFFSKNLIRLTDVSDRESTNFTKNYIQDFVFKILNIL
ncbi:MAG: TetR/AcrR family transcriptional regulator, partial [Sediminibacterium sp.]|nr:TetR/AcrR family transcriptional regulator [Sediminibacterium sp.]